MESDKETDNEPTTNSDDHSDDLPVKWMNKATQKLFTNKIGTAPSVIWTYIALRSSV